MKRGGDRSRLQGPCLFGENAKFFCGQVARASAAQGGGPEGQLGRFDDGGGERVSWTPNLGPLAKV